MLTYMVTRSPQHTLFTLQNFAASQKHHSLTPEQRREEEEEHLLLLPFLYPLFDPLGPKAVTLITVIIMSNNTNNISNTLTT